MGKLLPLFCLLFLSFVASAQSVELRLNIIAETGNEPVEATVRLFKIPDSILASSQVVRGEASFEVAPFTDYELSISATGFKSTSRVVSVKDSSLGIEVKLSQKSAQLSNVTVVAKRPLIKQDDDKTVVDAEALANSSSNAYEILEKIPGTVVDQDGNVYLSSTTPATIFINGREMKLSNADIASLLKSLPSGSVSKIELLRSPSAKFDAASSGGIVNIVLKKGVKLGTSGSVNAGHFQGVYGTSTAGFNLNKSAGKLTSYLNYQFTRRNNFEKLNSDRLTPTDSLVSQRSYTTYPSINNYVGGGIDYSFSSKFNLAYDVRVSNNNNKSYAENPIEIINSQSKLLLEKNRSEIDNDNHSTYIGNELSGKYKIDSLGSELQAQLEYNHYDYRNEQAYENSFPLPLRATVSGDGKNRNKKDIFVAQTDLLLKLPQKFTLEAGVKLSHSNSSNSSTYFKDSAGVFRFPDLYQTNAFRYKETIGAAYVQVSRTLAGFTIKPGARLETTDISGRQSIPRDTFFSIKRTDIFPYVFVKHDLWKMFGSPLTATAIYRRTIKRPYYETLNPYPKYIDQYLFDVGNPRLKPQFTTNYELNVTFQNFPVFAAGINQTKDIFSQVTYQDDNTKVAYRTYDNLGKNKEVYFKIIGGIPPGGKYFFYVGAQYNYNRYNGSYNGFPLNYSRGSYTFFMYQELKLTKTLTFNTQGFMRTKGIQNFYELNTFGGLYVSVNKSFFDKKANVILSVNDLLQTNRVGFNIDQGNVQATGERINDTRRLGITVRYNFGGKPKEEKKSFEAPAEAN